MLGVDRVVLDRGVEPEAVAVRLAVVEGRLELFAPSATAAPSAAPPRGAGAAPRRRVAARLVVARPRPRLGVGLLVLLGFLLGVLLLGRRRLDLGLDLVAEVDFAGAGVLVVGGEAVLFAELAQLAWR